jgi:hypothetical protein
MSRRVVGLLLLTSGTATLVYHLWRFALSIAAMHAKYSSSAIGFAPLDLWPSSWLWVALWITWTIAGAVLLRWKRLRPPDLRRS